MRALSALLACAALLGASLAYADTESSAHYTIEQGTLSGGGAPADSSASYSQSGALGEAVVGPGGSGSYSGTGGFDSSSGQTNSGASGSGNAAPTSSGGGVVLGCGDPSALNYSPQALTGSDASCAYSASALSQLFLSTASSTAVAPVSPAAAAAGASDTSAPAAVPSAYPINLALESDRIAEGEPLVVSAYFARAHPSAIVFSIVRADGTVATSSLAMPQAGANALAYTFSNITLPPGDYTLHARAEYPDHAEEYDQPFTVTDPPSGRSGAFAAWALAICIAIALAYLLFRILKRRS